ncbi:unnamed protein product [Orchesella dallaii]|uniref:Signal transducer and activator of transcription n=1 Tax=Orchesella dallaii TaxID=48710 RepID=A0ABP1RBQ9_9HEXA
MALWRIVKELDNNALGEIASLYTVHNIPIEVRDFCSIWIEASINRITPEAFIAGLSCQIGEKLRSLESCTAGTTPFYVMRRLVDFQTALTTIHTLYPQELYNQFIVCLESERLIVKRNEETPLQMKSPDCSTSISGSPPTVTQNINPALDYVAASSRSMGQYNGSQQQDMNVTRPNVIPTTVVEHNNAETFLNNPIRIVIDGEMNRVFEAVWSLEEANNMFSFKCHEMKRHEELRNQKRCSMTMGANVNGLQVYTELQELETQMSEIKAEILGMATVIWNKTSEVRTGTATILQSWIQLKSQLDNELAEWTQQQRQFSNGKLMTMSLNTLQYLSEYLMEVAWKLRHLLLSTDKIRQANVNFIDNNAAPGQATIPEHIESITSFIKKLVHDTFIVVHQPCQVLKTNTRFYIPPGKNPMEVRLLVGEKLSLQLTPPSISVSLIDESMAKTIEANGLDGEKFKKVVKKGRLLPENTRLDFCPETKSCAAIFRQISLKDFYRNGRKGAVGKDQTECVTEEKLCLLFRSEFTLGDVNFQIWRMSLPIVITTHGSQDSLAWAAVSWDNAFCKPVRVPFHVPDHASWNEISEMLNYRFCSIVGAPLTQENLNYFAEKLSSKPGFPNSLSWSELCKVNLPERKFTFWEWFFEGAKLIEQHLKEAWKNGYVKGFIGKESSENMLCTSGCQPGTFLFRFSDSILGGISIVWLHSDGKAYSLNPFRSKDLVNQPIIEKLNQETLHYVFPNVPKKEAFKKYYEDYKNAKSEETSTVDKDRYVKFLNQLVIDNPNIPKFCLAEKGKSSSGQYEMLTNSQLSSSFETKSPACADNFIEIDIDQIVACLSDQEVLAADYQSTINNFGDREGPRSAEAHERDKCTYADESFYMQL